MIFQRVYFLALIPVLIFYAFYYYKSNLYKNKLSVLLSNQVETDKFYLIHFLVKYFPFLRFIAILFFIIALAGPGSQISFLPDEKKGIDIMISVDVSGSMVRSQDFKPNRLEVAKNILKDFVSKRELDRIGIIAFAGAAYLQSPLTSDRNTLYEILTDLDNSSVEEAGTAIGDAILLSTYRLQKSKAKSKIIILLTDGASNIGKIDPLTASEIAKQYKIKIYSIGIGREEIGLASETDFSSLETISKDTEGLFFRAQDTQDLENVMNSIDTLEKDLLQNKPNFMIESKHELYLIIGILILLIDLLTRAYVLRFYI
jgi:Ca-activated chloride channel family protein